jgi:outer membrane autotransporter protein
MSLPPSLHLTWVALLLCCLNASAQTSTKAPTTSLAVECPPPKVEECLTRNKRAEEQERAERNSEIASPQLAGDAPLPPQGGGGPPPNILRGPLTVQRLEFSAGLDHALSRQWVLSGLVGVSRGRLERTQIEDPGPVSDTTVRTRSTTLAATLSYFPQPAMFIDSTLSIMRTRLQTARVVNDNAEFNGDNVGHGVGLSVNAGQVWRFGSNALVPQVGLEYADNRTDALHTTYRLYSEVPEARYEGFSVSEQRQKSLAALLGAQVQWPHSMAFGTLTPHLRVTWRERLWIDTNTVNATAPGADVRQLDPEESNSRRSLAVAGGIVAQFARGVSAFADLGYRRGTKDLRETRLALGIKFEH